MTNLLRHVRIKSDTYRLVSAQRSSAVPEKNESPVTGHPGLSTPDPDAAEWREADRDHDGAETPDADHVQRTTHQGAPLQIHHYAGDEPYEPSSSPAAEPDPATLEDLYETFKTRYSGELEEMRVGEFQRAYNEGFAAGKSDGLGQYDAKLSELAGLIESARQSIHNMLDGIADSAVDIVHEATVKIVGQVIAEKDGVLPVVREVVRQAKDRTRLIVRVSPRDVEMLNQACLQLTEGLSVGQIEIVGDDLVESGGCVLETPSGTLDGRLELQLQYLRDALETARSKWHDTANS